MHHSHHSRQSELHRKLEGLKADVFQEWEAELRRKVDLASDVPTAVLIDTLPMFYRHLVAIASHTARPSERSNLAEEHGGERARITEFDAQSIIHEFQIFRSSVLRVWAINGISLAMDDVIAINSAIDEAIRESVTGFIESERRFREQFFAAFAHDLRTPLGVAKMAVDMIKAGVATEQISLLANTASNQFETLSRMISDLLDSVVLDAGEGYILELAPVELLSLVDEAVHGAAMTSGAEIELKGTMVQGNWCRQAMRRAVENLVANAVKYRTRHSIVRVKVEQFQGRAIVVVENEGHPIPTEQQEKIFDMFKRATRSKSTTVGWGIGLPYVRSVAERHGGSIALACNDTTIRFILDVPLDPSQLEKIEQPDGSDDAQG